MRVYFKDFSAQFDRVGKLKDYCTMQYGYTETATTVPIGTKFFRITDIAQNHIYWKSVPYCSITEENHK